MNPLQSVEKSSIATLTLAIGASGGLLVGASHIPNPRVAGIVAGAIVTTALFSSVTSRVLDQ